MPVVEIRDVFDFRQRVSDAGREKLVVCDFYADWCGPCKFIAPLFVQLSEQFTNAIFCKVNVDFCRDVMQEYGVRAMPTFVLLKSGAEVERVQGANAQALQSAISRHYSATPTENPNAATTEERSFLDQFVKNSSRVRFYSDIVYKTLALSVIPNEKLIADSSAEGKLNRFLLAKNLAEWFKGEFFSWTDTPTCICGVSPSRNTLESGTPSAEEAENGASRVEVYVCACGNHVRFPRYNDPGKLLETRTGRCGEWANCFTLCAAAMDFDVRFVYDVTDHVWSELWIPELDRWVHVDPCENAVDSPLLYEKGWKKSLSYVVAFGLDHVYDVTWRYSIDYMKTVKLRGAVREPVLLNFLTKLSSRVGKNMDVERKKELDRRRLHELIEFLHVGIRSDGKEHGGRISGDEKWRTERGESGSNSCSSSPKRKQIVLRPNDQELAVKKFTLYYNCVTDQYNRAGTISKGFHSLVFKSKDVQHKKELDWKMVYLCRKEGRPEAELCWSVDLTGLKASRASLRMKGATTYEDGEVLLTVCADDMCVRVPKTGELVMDGPPSAILQIKAHFSGGVGDVAFQHSQLFRCSTTDGTEPHFAIEIEFE